MEVNLTKETKLRDAILLHKQVSELLADYFAAASHVLNMSLPRTYVTDKRFPGRLIVKFSYATMRQFATIRRNAREACLAAYGFDIVLEQKRQAKTFVVSVEDNTDEIQRMINILDEHFENKEAV